jgi:hypothetical protein
MRLCWTSFVIHTQQVYAKPRETFVSLVPFVVRCAGHDEQTTKDTKSTKLHEGAGKGYAPRTCEALPTDPDSGRYGD